MYALRESRRFMPAPSHTRTGGPMSKSLEYYGEERAVSILSWKGMFALSTLQALAMALQKKKT